MRAKRKVAWTVAPGAAAAYRPSALILARAGTVTVVVASSTVWIATSASVEKTRISPSGTQDFAASGVRKDRAVS